MAGASQRSIWATTPRAGDLPLNSGQVAARKTAVKPAVNQGISPLTRWGPADDDDNDNDNNNSDNEPLTRWGPPAPARTSETLKPKHSHRHNHFTTKRGTFSYSLDAGTAAVSEKTHFEARAAAAAVEWDGDEDDQKETITVNGADDERPTLGWEDTIFAPQLNPKSSRILADLTDIAETYGVAIFFKDSELRITADSQQELSDARRQFEIYLLSLAPPPAKAKFKSIAKADRPGVWGQPRYEYTFNDLYTPSAQ
ncbi:hypothetical protein HDU87_002846 [Geranomyces variabilis]|uniref:Uncharacterized protein n=1 Tax=Geranomyces variabilis TaxID=109894 RepID=A0AAD5XN59_9FUNG|nr:hypothetical protein HDU87_002846 [Geranomyces variabilis]